MFEYIYNTSFNDHTFETLISTQVLEHLFQTQDYINECHRIMKNGGYALFTVPQTYECHSKPYDYYRFTEFSLNKLFEEKFEIVKISPLDNSIETVNQLFITSVLFGNFKQKDELSIIDKVLYKVTMYTLVPFINIFTKAIKMFSTNYDLCLNYIVIVKKSESCDS